VPFREESCRSSCIYSGPLHSHSRDAVSQHPSTRAGAESIQLIYSGRALQALSDLARQFRCHPIFWREFSDKGRQFRRVRVESFLFAFHLPLLQFLVPSQIYMTCSSGVRSLKELWERNGNSHSHNSDTVMGTGREPGIILLKKFACVSWQFFFENR